MNRRTLLKAIGSAKLLKWYDEGAARISFDFLPDDVYDSVVKRPRNNFGFRADLRHEAMDYWEVNPEYKQLMTRGTPSEWGRLFQQIPNDDLYWQKVCRTLGLHFPP